MGTLAKAVVGMRGKLELKRLGEATETVASHAEELQRRPLFLASWIERVFRKNTWSLLALLLYLSLRFHDYQSATKTNCP